jgi:hypothetical protein
MSSKYNSSSGSSLEATRKVDKKTIELAISSVKANAASNL